MKMSGFMREERGYALVLTLLFMPIFMGLSLMIIDAGRGDNAHSDLSAAADAMALAAAGELDGGDDAITRAKAAMLNVSNSVSFLGLDPGDASVMLSYEDVAGNAYNVIFLDDIPTNDSDPIDQDWVDAHGTTSGADAKYVYVWVQSKDLDAIFPVPLTYARGEVAIQAEAVAGRRAAACGITPLFICNPFEADASLGGDDLQEAFSKGKMHGRIVKLHPKGSDTAGPGNFGFLQVGGNAGASNIREYFASGDTPQCYDSETVDLKPGAATSIKAGLNIRFDIWDAPFKGNGPKNYTPALNVRKGYYDTDTTNTSDCDTALSSDTTQYLGFEDNTTMEDPGNNGIGLFLGTGSWPADEYWAVNHNGGTLPSSTFIDDMSSFPNALSPGYAGPSRYDVYRYEIDNGYVGDGSVGGEDGNPSCSTETQNYLPATDVPDRRIIQAAVINCIENQDLLNGAKTIPVEAFASLFLTNPMEGTNGGNVSDPDAGTINAEVIDITGTGGLGTLENYIRVEAVLVR